jgi:DNA repair protein RadD
MAEIALRSYQAEATERVRQNYRERHRSQMLVLPTGAGKTVVAAYLMKAASERGTPTAFVVDRVDLVDQTSAVLDAYDIEHGIIQAKHWRYRPDALIQVCSAQTLEKRGFFPNLKFLVVDEAHAIRKQTVELIKSRADLKVLGLTATPFTTGLGLIYPTSVNTITMNELVSSGFLVPIRQFAAKQIDMRGAKVKGGEWDEREIEDRGRVIIGDIVAEWIQKTQEMFGGPVKTICFAPTVDYGADLCERFQAAGYNFQQISYKDHDPESRKERIAEFKRTDGNIHGLVSCEVFTKGFDAPDVLCGISARPYRKSLSSHIQQLGRVARPAPGKTFALWLDHSGNAVRFFDDTEAYFARGVEALDLDKLRDKAPKEKDDAERAEILCSCGMVMPPRAERCPSCGKERVRRNTVRTMSGVMQELGTTGSSGVTRGEVERVWWQICGLAIRRKSDPAKRNSWAYAQFRNIFKDLQPPAKFNEAKATAPGEAVIRMVNKNIAAFQIRSRFSKQAHR